MRVGRAEQTAWPLDSGTGRVHTHVVGALPNRLNIPDARGRGASLRVTRHSEQRKVVLSHWRDGVCVASTPVDLGELPALIGVLVEALGDAAAISPPTVSRGHPGKPSIWRQLRDHFRPTVGKIVDLPHRHGLQREVTK
jgi:hypothetical protein